MERCIGHGVWSAPKGRDHNALGLGTPLGLQKQTLPGLSPSLFVLWGCLVTPPIHLVGVLRGRSISRLPICLGPGRARLRGRGRSWLCHFGFGHTRQCVGRTHSWVCA